MFKKIAGPGCFLLLPIRVASLLAVSPPPPPSVESLFTLKSESARFFPIYSYSAVRILSAFRHGK